MKILIVGLAKEELVKEIHANYPRLEIVAKDPEVVVCYGGDGTLLYAERIFPGIPKAMIRNSRVCKLCSTETGDTILSLLQRNDFQIVEHTKLEAHVNKQILYALNDIVIGHQAVNGTLRSQVYLNGQQYGDEIFGDGVVISTPLGSTGYYQSITRSNFRSGIGIAFNNSITSVSHLVVDKKTTIEVEVTRGPGVVASDNDERALPLPNKQRAKIMISDKIAKIIKFPKEFQKFNVNTGSDRAVLEYCQICRVHYEQ